MTTPTTSRMSGAMVNAAGQVFLDYDHFVPPTLLERALEAALANQGDVVAVSELQTLVDDWSDANYFSDVTPESVRDTHVQNLVSLLRANRDEGGK